MSKHQLMIVLHSENQAELMALQIRLMGMICDDNLSDVEIVKVEFAKKTG